MWVPMEMLPSGTTKLRILIDPRQFNALIEKESDISLSLSLLLVPWEKQEPEEKAGVRWKPSPVC